MSKEIKENRRIIKAEITDRLEDLSVGVRNLWKKMDLDEDALAVMCLQDIDRIMDLFIYVRSAKEKNDPYEPISAAEVVAAEICMDLLYEMRKSHFVRDDRDFMLMHFKYNPQIFFEATKLFREAYENLVFGFVEPPIRTRAQYAQYYMKYYPRITTVDPEYIIKQL